MWRTLEHEGRMCPFWHELTTDFLCMCPRPGYCVGAEHGKPRFPSGDTTRRHCTADFWSCEGFQRRTQCLIS